MARHGKKELSAEEWLLSEGIVKRATGLPRFKKQYKSLPGQLSLIERDADGKPRLLTSKKPTKRKAKK